MAIRILNTCFEIFSTHRRKQLMQSLCNNQLLQTGSDAQRERISGVISTSPCLHRQQWLQRTACMLALSATLAGCKTGQTWTARKSPIAEPTHVVATSTAKPLSKSTNELADNSKTAPSDRVTESVEQSASKEKTFAVSLTDEPTAEKIHLTGHHGGAPIVPAAIPDEVSSPDYSGPGLTLAALEDLAITQHPSIFETSASAQKASGYRDQVGRKPNPTVGYEATQLADDGTDQHVGFIEQEIVLGGKLKLNERVLDQEIQSQLWEVEAQRYRVLTDVRQKFYDALAVQERYRLSEEFRRVAEEGVRMATIRREALEGSLPEQLQAEIQLQEMELAVERASLSYRAAWQELAVAAGNPYMQMTPLEGELRLEVIGHDWDATYEHFASSSPVIQAATARVSRAQINMERQRVQPIPNLGVALAAGYDQGTQSEMVNLSVGIPLPLFNQNKGNISAAYAEYCRATQELKRLQFDIKAKLAQASQSYDFAAGAVERFEKTILPKAEQTLDLSEKAYAAGEYGFLDVLIARKTYFDTNLQYVDALAELAQSHTLVEGMLLSGGLETPVDTSFDDGLRGQTFSQE